MSYLQLKNVCLNCDAHFVVCTNFPELFELNRMYCPHCGQPGTSIRHSARVEGKIEDLIPGDSPFEGVGNRVNPAHFEDCEPKDYLRADMDTQDSESIVTTTVPEFQGEVERLRTDQAYAVEIFNELWQLILGKDPTTLPKRHRFVRLLRAAKPDLSPVITDDLRGEYWARSQFARLIMNPALAKQASLKRLIALASDKSFGTRTDS